MHCIQIYIEEETHKKILEKSKDRNIGMSTLIREILKREMGLKTKVKRSKWFGKNVKYLPGDRGIGDSPKGFPIY